MIHTIKRGSIRTEKNDTALRFTLIDAPCDLMWEQKRRRL